jgi:5-methyltetrahydrofolate--homocysteine methyltransferase
MMTSTVGRIGEVASALKEEWLDITVISGGASMNGELAATYGVLYAKDSVEALSACKKIVEATGRNT